MVVTVDVATRLKRARLAAGLTQASLAARVFTTQPAIAAYEAGTRTPSASTIDRILDAIGIRPSAALSAHRAEVLDLADRHRAHDVRVFGSVARGDDTTSSDLDVLVRFDRGVTLIDVAVFEAALADLLGVEVDVVSEGGLSGHRHRAIHDDAIPV